MSQVVEAFKAKYGPEPQTQAELLQWQAQLEYFIAGWDAGQQDFAKMLQWEFDNDI